MRSERQAPLNLDYSAGTPLLPDVKQKWSSLLQYFMMGSLISALAVWSSPVSARELKSAEPKPTVELRVSIDGKAYKTGEPFPLPVGQSVQLKVEILHSDGSLLDVTNDPKTSYFSVTPWNISTTRAGFVTAKPDPTFSAVPDNTGVGGIAITYGVTGDKDIGATSIVFDMKSDQGETTKR